MSNRTRGLFDPRRRMQNWPEPHDDPNIPYVWGQGTTNLGAIPSGSKPLQLTKENIQALRTMGDVAANEESKKKKLWWILGGVSVVGLGVGVYMYTKL